LEEIARNHEAAERDLAAKLERQAAGEVAIKAREEAVLELERAQEEQLQHEATAREEAAREQREAQAQRERSLLSREQAAGEWEQRLRGEEARLAEQTTVLEEQRLAERNEALEKLTLREATVADRERAQQEQRSFLADEEARLHSRSSSLQECEDLLRTRERQLLEEEAAAKARCQTVADREVRVTQEERRIAVAAQGTGFSALAPTIACERPVDRHDQVHSEASEVLRQFKEKLATKQQQLATKRESNAAALGGPPQHRFSAEDAGSEGDGSQGGRQSCEELAPRSCPPEAPDEERCSSPRSAEQRLRLSDAANGPHLDLAFAPPTPEGSEPGGGRPAPASWEATLPAAPERGPQDCQAAVAGEEVGVAALQREDEEGDLSGSGFRQRGVAGGLGLRASIVRLARPLLDAIGGTPRGTPRPLATPPGDEVPRTSLSSEQASTVDGTPAATPRAGPAPVNSVHGESWGDR
jgi:hypothetical protein